MEACDIQIGRLMGRNIRILHSTSDTAKADSAAVTITAAYGEHQFLIDAGKLTPILCVTTRGSKSFRGLVSLQAH